MCEIRRTGTRIEEYNNFILCHTGHTPGKRGVGFIINKTRKNWIESFMGINDRVALLNLNIQGLSMSIIQIYAPTETACEEEINNFYTNVNRAVDQAYKNYIIMGDFNAKIGQPRKDEHLIMKPNGYGERNQRGFNFPKLPGKWPFTLSEQQLDSRRRGLEQYLEKVCAVRVIAECESVQEFLTDCDDSSNPAPVELKVLLPDRDVATVSVLRSTRADLVYRAVADKIRLADTVQQYFYLFEIVEYNFERKLQPNECPHSLYIQNYSTASSSCLCIRKWLFNPRVEVALVAEDPLAANFIFWQAVEDVNRGTCAAGARLYQLKAMQEPRRAHDYLALARTLPGYGHVAIPHPTLRLALGWSGIKLSPHEEEAPGEECAEVPWSCVLGWARDDDATAVRLTYARPDRPPRTLLLCTPYYQFLANCMDRIAEEANWADTGE
ncbi:sorting nexin-27-like [Bombyx mandarina]|uniref:Sorting nexin-27-like n=1 Tax=Bombyx mandarina TaxID=7092 RepID=A0A6J2K6N9_BOMMA|nr:sorting nexin-27-like [Bombyx mandarina]